jgi:DNA-binding response OmpR family regulator
MTKREFAFAFVSPDGLARDRPARQVLVVDDDDDLRSTVAEILTDEGFAVVEAANGSAALDYLLDAPKTPSLILLDLNMPIMSGREMIHILQGYLRLSTIPVLVVSSDCPPVGGAEQGTVGRLQKPFSAPKLLALVRRHARPAR